MQQIKDLDMGFRIDFNRQKIIFRFRKRIRPGKQKYTMQK